MEKYYTMNQFFEAIARGEENVYFNSSEEVQKKPEVAMAAIRYGLSLSQLHLDCASNKDVVRLAVEKNGGMELRYADEKLRADKDFVMSLGEIDPKVFFECSMDLQYDKEFASEVIKKYGREAYDQMLSSEFLGRRDKDIGKELKKADKKFTTEAIGKGTINTPTEEKLNAKAMEQDELTQERGGE